MEFPFDSIPSAPEGAKLKQQNIQLQHLLKYKDDVEIPALKRQVAEMQSEVKGLRTHLSEVDKRDEFLESQTGLIHLDGENRIIRLNAFALEVLGTTSQRALGRPIFEVGVNSQNGRPIFNDFEYHLEPEGRESEWEKEIPMANGEKRYYHFRSALSEGVRLLSIVDVTDFRIAESRLKAIVSTSKSGMALVDESGIIRATNSRFGKLFGLNWRQFEGMHFDIAAGLLQYHFNDPQSFMDFVSEARSDAGKHQELLFEMVLPLPASYEVFTRPVTDEQGRQIGRVWYITDVTTFKNMEKRLNAINIELEEKVRVRTEQLERRTEELENKDKETEIELEVAKQVQQGILPKDLPSPPGYRLAAEYLPTGKVSGDFYQIEFIDPQHLFLLIADVSGHGVPAALVTALAKMAFDRHVRAGRSVSEALTKVNLDLCEAIRTDHYLTAFAGILETATGRLTYSRVCHPYPLLWRNSTRSLEALDARGGFFLGMFKDSRFTEAETVLRPGDTLFVYTDGVTETMNAREQLYGRKRLESVVSAAAGRPPVELLEMVIRDKDRFGSGRPSQDDISMFSIQRQPA